jgi:hypothetical protein
MRLRLVLSSPEAWHRHRPRGGDSPRRPPLRINCRNCRKSRRGRPVGKVRLSYDPRRTSRPRRAPNIPFTGSTHPLLFEAGCGVAIATAGRTSGQCYYRVPRFRGRAVVIREPGRPACGDAARPRPPAGGRLGPAPNGRALQGAARRELQAPGRSASTTLAGGDYGLGRERQLRVKLPTKLPNNP